MVRTSCLFAVTLLAAALFIAPRLGAQPPAAKKPELVKLNFPAQVDLTILIDYVSERLGIKILYDTEVTNKRISIKAPEAIPIDSLLGVLESALKMKGLALADADQPGWKRIVKTEDLPQIARAGQKLEGATGSMAVTQAFALTHIDATRLTQVVQPFLTQPGANVITLADQNLLIITDFADNIRKIAGLIETIDRGGPKTVLEFYKVQHVEASALSKQVQQIMTVRSKSKGVAEAAASKLDIAADDRTNQLVIVGTRERVDEALKLLRTLDVSLGVTTKVYTLEYISADRIDRLVKELLDPIVAKRLYRAAIDREDNLLIVTASPAVHQQIEWLKRTMDVEAKRPGSAVKFYRLKNADVTEVLQTITAIERQGPSGPGRHLPRGVSPLGRGGDLRDTGRSGIKRLENERFVPGPNQPGQPGSDNLPVPPAVRKEEAEPLAASTGGTPGFGIVPGAARVTADPSSNTIIVVADRAVQHIYADLIRFLDRRRPQVMIEAKVVIIDTSDDFSIGVEYSTGDRSGIKRLLEFTSFGLSQVNPVTGALALMPGRGFNFTLVDPDEADAVLRALATHRRARVTSAPRILVNDNATGTLASVAEVPFTSVNASNTVATTSFAGFAEAGTTIEVTPRISDDDHLQLDFVVSLNSFTGAGGNGVPPPRQTDEVSSSVTIPDGHTIIVGGLTRTNTAFTLDGIPFVEKIPILAELTQNSVKTSSQSTLYVFLRPVILRDDKFRFLKFISERDVRYAKLPGEFPQSAPLLVR